MIQYLYLLPKSVFFFFLLAQALFYMKHDILAKMIYSIDVKKCCILKSNLVTNMEKIPRII